MHGDYVFVYSKNSAGTHKIYHTEQCPVVHRIGKSHVGYFYTAQEAEDNGYHLCKVCQYRQLEML